MLSYFKYVRLIMLYNHIATIFIFIIVVISICNTVYCKKDDNDKTSVNL